MKPGPETKEGPVATALSLGTEGFVLSGAIQGFAVFKVLTEWAQMSQCPWQQAALQVKRGGSPRCTPVQPAAGPGTPLAQDIHQQLAQDLLGLNWFLGCCFGFGLLRGKVHAEEPL